MIADIKCSVASVRDEGDENSVEFEKNDWVLCSGKLASIIRVGFDQYAGKIRVAFPNENPASWASGSWRPCSSIVPLRMPARFRTASAVVSADEPPVTIPC